MRIPSNKYVLYVCFFSTARRQPFYVRFRSDGYESVDAAISEGTQTDTGFALDYTLDSSNC